jgi:hypothetical protein
MAIFALDGNPNVPIVFSFSTRRVGAPMLREEQIPKLIADLKRLDLVEIKWKGRGMLCGNPYVANPRILDVMVKSAKQAWAINRAKEALSQGDEDAARAELAAITRRQLH